VTNGGYVGPHLRLFDRQRAIGTTLLSVWLSATNAYGSRPRSCERCTEAGAAGTEPGPSQPGDRRRAFRRGWKSKHKSLTVT